MYPSAPKLLLNWHDEEFAVILMIFDPPILDA